MSRSLTWDGTNLWVISFDDSTVTKVRGRDGVIVGTYGIGRLRDPLDIKRLLRKSRDLVCQVSAASNIGHRFT